MTAVHLIAKGRVQAEYPGGSFILEKGDIIGVCELESEVHLLGYTTLEECLILTYPVNNITTLDDFLQKRPDLTQLFLLSMFRQITILLEKSSHTEMRCTSLHQNLTGDYEKYNMLCSRYHIPTRSLEGLEEITDDYLDESSDMWLNAYYIGLHHIYANQEEVSKALSGEPGVSLGLLRKGNLDFRRTYTVMDDQYRYCARVAEFYFNASGNDLFDFFTSLYFSLGQNNEDADSLYADITQMILQFQDDPALDRALVAPRVSRFQNSLSVMTPPKGEDARTDSAAVMRELAGSLNTILRFAALDPKLSETFRKNVNAYKAMSDRNEMDEESIRLRRQLTEHFYALYSTCFELAAAGGSYIPVPVKLFLYFGYVDEELAGTANCVALYHLALDMEDTGTFGVYTFYHWLLAIYNGKKNPSRNEFDEDYTDYIHKLNRSGKISDSEAKALESSPIDRVRYELTNLFPLVNKITCGHITTFCPLFSDDNVIKNLNTDFVHVSQVVRVLNQIRSIDYSAFYRESMDYDNIDIMGKETIHLEYLPDIILMPNIGIRGVMWQEIEGKKRNSPGRMFLSIFHMEDIHLTLVRLTGEFRWEMCKRIQGSRWNDVSERSLTSEYFDYIQFYRKNHELSGEAKEKIKNGLQRAKNSFKEMFVRDYIIWVMFEGKGSPRLNKVARNIFCSYCPFPAAMLPILEQNPIYADLLGRQKLLNGQKLRRLDMLKQKLQNSGIPIPDTLEKEYAFTEGKPY